MSLVIFFGMALIIFLTGLTVIGVTLYRWRELKKANQSIPSWTKSKTNLAP